MNRDDDIRRLLAEDAAEPGAALDDRIRAAAREAVAASAATPAPTVRSHRYRWASGIGAAAALLLAVLIVQRVPDDSILGSAPAEPAGSAAPAAPGEPAEPAASAPRAHAPAMYLERQTLDDAEADVAPAPLRFSDLTVSIDAGTVEVRQSPPTDCPEPLVLETPNGPATARQTDEGLIISVEGAERWTVRCEPGGWSWYNTVTDDKGIPR